MTGKRAGQGGGNLKNTNINIIDLTLGGSCRRVTASLSCRFIICHMSLLVGVRSLFVDFRLPSGLRFPMPHRYFALLDYLPLLFYSQIMAYLLKPLTLRSMTLPNRLVMPPMATAKAELDGKVSQALLDYYSEKSRGGYISLIIIEHSFISPEGKASSNQLSVADDAMLPGLRTLAEAIHRNGSRTAMQINHAGSAAQREITGTTPLAPSAVTNPRQGDMPREIARKEIPDIVKAFQKAARRVKDAGFDAVEIHSAHGYLLNQYLSPLTNKRTVASR